MSHQDYFAPYEPGDARRRSSDASEGDNVGREKILATCQTAYDVAERYGILDFIQHPLNYADLMIRIGYEPFQPILKRSVFTFFRTTYVLPGRIPYARYLIHTDRSLVLQTFAPCLAENVTRRAIERWDNEIRYIPPEEPSLVEVTTMANIENFVSEKTRQFWKAMWITIATQPFRVIAVRCMASIVDENPSFSDLLSCIITTLKTEGIRGFYVGLKPRLYADLICAVTSAGLYLSIVHGLQLLHLQQSVSRRALSWVDRGVEVLSDTVASNYAQQFKNISDIMVVNGTSLAMGNPPYTPIFRGWWDCWRTISSHRLHGRGGYFYRFYYGPFDERGPSGAFGPTYDDDSTSISGIQEIPSILREFYAFQPQIDLTEK